MEGNYFINCDAMIRNNIQMNLSTTLQQLSQCNVQAAKTAKWRVENCWITYISTHVCNIILGYSELQSNIIFGNCMREKNVLIVSNK